MTGDELLLRRLGKRCRQMRLDRGLSQLDMVRSHGFSLSHYQKIERGALDARLSTLQRYTPFSSSDSPTPKASATRCSVLSRASSAPRSIFW